MPHLWQIGAVFGHKNGQKGQKLDLLFSEPNWQDRTIGSPKIETFSDPSPLKHTVTSWPWYLSIWVLVYHGTCPPVHLSTQELVRPETWSCLVWNKLTDYKMYIHRGTQGLGRRLFLLHSKTRRQWRWRLHVWRCFRGMVRQWCYSDLVARQCHEVTRGGGSAVPGGHQVAKNGGIAPLE